MRVEFPPARGADHRGVVGCVPQSRNLALVPAAPQRNSLAQDRARRDAADDDGAAGASSSDGALELAEEHVHAGCRERRGEVRDVDVAALDDAAHRGLQAGEREVVAVAEHRPGEGVRVLPVAPSRSRTGPPG